MAAMTVHATCPKRWRTRDRTDRSVRARWQARWLKRPNGVLHRLSPTLVAGGQIQSRAGSWTSVSSLPNCEFFKSLRASLCSLSISDERVPWQRSDSSLGVGAAACSSGIKLSSSDMSSKGADPHFWPSTKTSTVQYCSSHGSQRDPRLDGS
eukprot:2038234-Rhodomonas_salina.1